MSGILETPKMLAARVGLAESAIKRLIDDGLLAFIPVGLRRRIPPGAWEDYLATHTVKSCRDAMKVQGFASSTSAAVSTSSGQRTAGAASAAQARQMAMKLRSNSRSSCTATRESSGRVIPLKSS